MGTSTGHDSIESLGHPLGFKVRDGRRAAALGAESGRTVFRVEARQLAGHQKEAVLTEGADGPAWRVTTDEDGHLRGTDLAPFPLGFFNAGLQGDVIARLLLLAEQRSMPVTDVDLRLDTGYSMTGSFFTGTGQGFAEPARIDLGLGPDADVADEVLEALVADAVEASPALALMRIPVANTFALYVNGVRREVTSLRSSLASDVPDPFVTWTAAPSPGGDATHPAALIRKTGEQQQGTPEVAPGDMTSQRQIRPVIGTGRLADRADLTDLDVVLGMPGASHFAFRTDERPGGVDAPSGLGLVAAGIAFCYMTQLSRYVEYQKLAIRGVRLVQDIPFTTRQDDGRLVGGLEAADTHLFLSADEHIETCERFMQVAERTCYLHATMADQLDPVVTVRSRS